MKKRLALTNGTRDFLWENKTKLSFDQDSGSRGTILCSNCEQNWATKLLAYKKMFPARAFVYDRMEPFRQNWADIKISSIKRHLISDFCTVIQLSAKSSSSDGNHSVTALESLILLCIQQCKDHLPALVTRGLVQWGVLSGLNTDIIQGFGVTHNLKMRLLIGRYCLNLFFKAVQNGHIKYLHVGSDSQKMNFQQKWVNFFVRYTIDGQPVTSTLGVQRVFGNCTGVHLRQLLEDLVSGRHIHSEIQTGKTLHTGLSDSDSDDDGHHGTSTKHVLGKLNENGVLSGMDWKVFLEHLVSISTDGGSDFAGRHIGFTGMLKSEVPHVLNSYWCCSHVWDLISKDLSSNSELDVFKLSDEFFTDLGNRCRASSLFKDALEQKLRDEGIKPFSFCLKLAGRWEMSEYEILKKIVSSLKVLVQVKDPDNPSQGLYDEIRRIASVYVCLVIREINVTTLMEPSEQHILNPVLLYRLVEDCILRYSQIVRGTIPDAITNLLNNLQFDCEQLYDDQGRLLRGQYEEKISLKVSTGPGTSRCIPLRDTVGQPPIVNRPQLEHFIFYQLKKAAKILLVKLRGGDDRNEPGEIFSNWDYVKLAASCLDNRKFACRPVDFDNHPRSEQEDLKNMAVNRKLDDFKNLVKQRQDIISTAEGILLNDSTIEESWTRFVTHVYVEFPQTVREMDYYAFWKLAHQDAVLQSDCIVVLALNSIINTECGSNATAEHLGHMSNLITQKQRERLKPFRASNEMIVSYMMPSLPDIVRLGIHTKLAMLWRRIGGRDPTGKKGQITFKKTNILKEGINKPTQKNKLKKTKYFKKLLHQLEAISGDR